MLFTFLAALAARQTMALRPDLSRTGVSQRIATIGDLLSTISNPKESMVALQTASGIVDGILAETGNATEHMSDDDAALLRSVIDLVETSIYGSMDSAHAADVQALADGVHAVEQCNADIALRQAPKGDLGKLHQSASDDQTELDRLQGVVDEETSNNASAWDTFNNHMQMISSPPACPGLPGRTMPQLDVFFEKSEYSIWFAHHEAAYAAARAIYVSADDALAAAIEAYNIQKAIRDTQYCDWKAELEAACASFDACFAEKSDDFNKRLVPRVMGDVNSRIEVFKAGETLIHQIKFLLADVTNQETPDIDSSRFELDIPTLPEKGVCDLSVLTSPEWSPPVECTPECVFKAHNDGIPDGVIVEGAGTSKWNGCYDRADAGRKDGPGGNYQHQQHADATIYQLQGTWRIAVSGKYTVYQAPEIKSPTVATGRWAAGLDARTPKGMGDAPAPLVHVAFAERTFPSPAVIKNVFSGRRLFAQSDKSGENGVGAMLDGPVHADQKWNIESVGGGMYKVENFHSGRRLFAQVSKSGESGVGAMSTGHLHEDQKWFIEDLGDGKNVLRNVHNGRRLYGQDDKGGTKSFNGEIGVGAMSSGTVWEDQEWFIEAA